jgi:molybdate transport system substrate-binding protein
VAVLLAASLASCSDAHTEQEKERAESGTDPRVITVYQPPELVPAMKALAVEFGRDHPEVAFTYDTQTPSAQRKQIDAGAKPSLWIDLAETIDPYASDPRAQAPPFDLGSNVFQFVVRAGNPKGITDLEVFSQNGGPYPGARTGLCDEGVRCGAAGGRLLGRQDVEPAPTKRYPDGDQLVADLAADQLDAGLVYRTSSAPLGPQLTVVPLPAPNDGLSQYHMLRFTTSSTAAEFEEFLSTPAARDILTAQGLLPKVA